MEANLRARRHRCGLNLTPAIRRQRLTWASYRIRKIAHALVMPGTFSPPPTSKETASKRSRHASWHVRHARVGIDNPRWRGKRSRHSRRMRNTQFTYLAEAHGSGGTSTGHECNGGVSTLVMSHVFKFTEQMGGSVCGEHRGTEYCHNLHMSGGARRRKRTGLVGNNPWTPHTTACPC